MIESWDYHKECTIRRFDPKSNPQAQIFYRDKEQQYKERNKKSHSVSNNIYAVFIIVDGKERYYGRTPIIEQAETCVNNLAKRNFKSVIKDWKGEEKDGQVRNYL